MELVLFIQNFAGVFYGLDSSAINADTNFWEMEEWSSLSALSVISMIDEIYGVSLRSADLKGIKTIGQLFDAVMSKVDKPVVE